MLLDWTIWDQAERVSTQITLKRNIACPIGVGKPKLDPTDPGLGGTEAGSWSVLQLGDQPVDILFIVVGVGTDSQPAMADAQHDTIFQTVATDRRR